MMRLCNPNRAGRFAKDTVGALPDTLVTCQILRIPLCWRRCSAGSMPDRWAVPLRDAIVRAGGKALADEWLHPSDLAELGPAFARAGAA